MVTVSEILMEKGDFVLSIPAKSTVLQATLRMNEYSVGGLVVTDEQGHVVGIFTERDVLVRVVAAELAADSVQVGDVMTREVACCSPETTLEQARSVMKNRRIRHLPVVNAKGELGGLISIGDLNAYHATDQESTIYFLHEYLYGRV